MSNGAKTVLITGASSGIGYELAKLFARDRHRLVLVARSESELKRAAGELAASCGVHIQIIPKDLSLPGSPEEIRAEVDVHVDVLVNNAGFGTYGPFVEIPIATELEMMRLNMLALTHLTYVFLPGMVAKRSGQILNVASTAAFQPGPLMAVYYASKAYVLSFSEALAFEVAPSGVTVSVLCPGPTRTEFQKHAKMERSRLFDGGTMDAASVAAAGYRGLMKGRTVIIPGVRNRVLAAATRLAPRKLLPLIVREMQKPR